MENIVLYLMLIRRVRWPSLAYAIQCHVKVAHISPGYGTYLNVDKEMIARAPIIEGQWNLKMNEESLVRVYLDYRCDFKINNTLVYQIFSKLFTDMGSYVYVKQRKSMQDGQAVLFHIHKHFFNPDHVVRQAADAERKLQTSHYDGERKWWDWDKYVTLHKEQHVIMESLTDYCYSRIDNGTKVCHFLQGIMSTKLEATVNVVWAQTEKYEQILKQLCLIWAKWSQRKSHQCNLAVLLKGVQ